MMPTPELPSVVAQVVRDVRSLADRATGAGGLAPATPHERAAWLVGLRLVVDAAESAFTQVLTDFDAHGDGERLHAAVSTQAWLRGALGMASGEASERVRIARASGDLLATALAASTAQPETAELADDSSGHVSYEHVRVIHRTLRALPPSARPEGAQALTALGRQLGVDDLRSAGRYLRQVIDPDGSARQCEEDYQRRWLSLAPMLDGMHSIDGVLGAESAASLSAALAPFLVPTGPDDCRTADQRRADGLTEVVTVAVRSGELPTLSGTSTALQVEVPLAVLAGASRTPGRLAGTSHTSAWLTPEATLRLSCDASVRRLLLDPNAVPLDLGRAVRAFTPAQRKALAVRDLGCRFPGCHRPALHTDAHHLVAWARGGVSDLANGLLLCRFHHRAVHDGGWTVTPARSTSGANGLLHFRGPHGQRLLSPLPTAPGAPDP
jgi:hypothetical protein